MPGNEAGSLTKEINHDTMMDTIRGVYAGMTYNQLREYAANNTHSDMPGIIRKRFIKIENNVVVYDRLLQNLDIYDLNSFYIRKILYFTWAYRNRHLRNFILERIAGPDGKWRPEELEDLVNANFFDDFAQSTRPKIRSNIRWFLRSTGIYDDDNNAIHLELDDGWFFEACQVAAQYEPHPETRYKLVTDPVEAIIELGLAPLVNATPAELRTQGVKPVGVDTTLDDVEFASTGSSKGQTSTWNSQEPEQGGNASTQAYIDLVARERANRAHWRLEKLMADAVEAQGLVPKHNKHIDLCFENGTWVLCEMKSCNANNIHAQLRKAISQLFEYRYTYRRDFGSGPTLVVVLETKPAGNKKWLIKYLEAIRIIPAWKRPDAEGVYTTATIPAELDGIIQPEPGT